MTEIYFYIPILGGGMKDKNVLDITYYLQGELYILFNVKKPEHFGKNFLEFFFLLNPL